MQSDECEASEKMLHALAAEAERDEAQGDAARLREALEKLTRLLSELRPGMTLPNATQWAHLEEAHNLGCAALAPDAGKEWLRALVTRAVEAGDQNVDGGSVGDAKRIRPLTEVVEEVLRGA